MGTVLSSPKDNGTYWNQLRPSKSTFSLKDRNGAGSSSGVGSGFFRHSLSGSVSIRKLSQASFSRRKEKQTHQHQHQHQHQQQQQPTISTISSASCWGTDAPRLNSPDATAKSSAQKLQAGGHAKHDCPAPIGCHSKAPALTKSTSCYAIKSASATCRSSGPSEGKENDVDNDSRKIVIQASTSDLLKCMGAFLHKKCRKVTCEPSAMIGWIRSIDRSLILQGWADMAFVNPANLVFLFMLMKAVPADQIHSERQLQASLFTCMYIAYSYVGNEISYPLKPFLIDENRDAFWDRCLGIINTNSENMLKINSDTTFFIDLFTELKSYS